MQFNTFDQGADKHTAINMLEDFNRVLQEHFLDACPQMYVGSILEDDIEIAD